LALRWTSRGLSMAITEDTWQRLVLKSGSTTLTLH